MFIRIIMLLLCMWSAVGNAQSGYTQISQRYNWLAGQFRALNIPGRGANDTTLATGQSTYSGAILADTVNNVIYWRSSGRWWAVGGTFDTTAIYAALATKLNIIDTLTTIATKNDLDGLNLVIRRAGSGVQSWYSVNDTLKLKDVTGETFIVVDTKTDSTLRWRLDTASSGFKAYIAANAGGANTALSNLSSVAVNTDLNPGSNNANDIGSNTFSWKNIYAYGMILRGSSSGAITLVAPATAGTNTITFPATTGSVPLLNTTNSWTGTNSFAALNITGTATITNNLNTSIAPTNSTLSIAGSATASSTTITELLFAGGSTINYRALSRGSANFTLVNGQPYSTWVIGEHAITEPASGTIPFVANYVIKAPRITNGSATTTDAATVYIEGPPVGTATVTNPVSTLWLGSGHLRMGNGNLKLQTAGNKIEIADGSNASIGTATLVAGTVTVSTTAVSASSKIFVSVDTPGGTQGFLSAPTASIVAGTSFVINSSSASETSTVYWWIIN